MELGKSEIEELRTLEESLWVDETRFDRTYMETLLAPDFFEFGSSGKTYTREEVLAAPAFRINARLPLKDFNVRAIREDVALVTYISEVGEGAPEVGNRSSLWVRKSVGWCLAFHQGTVVRE